VIERSQPNGIKQKMRKRRLKSGVNCQKDVKQTSIKQALGVNYLFLLSYNCCQVGNIRLLMLP
jgi:hypothetical protein